MSDRSVVLGRIRAALADVPADEAVAWSAAEDRDTAVAYSHADTIHDAPARVQLFIERCGDYSANVTTCADHREAIAAAITQACKRHGAQSVVVPPTLEAAWRPGLAEITVDDPPLAVEQLDRSDAVISGCAVAIAETGTIVLDSGSGQGRRALTLVPDLHICVVRSEQIVVSVPEALSALTPAFHDGRPVTFISGPSATSDIELTRVEGVHGPRRLEVIVVSSEVA